MAAVLIDHWPLFGLSVRTGRLELRPPTDADLAELAGLAAKGVNEPGRRTFLMNWNDLPPAGRALHVIQNHWRSRGSWTPQDWSLELAVVVDGQPIGMQEIRAKEFGLRREIASSSWLGLEHQGRGVGTLMRAAGLYLAFAGLGAEHATTGAFADNHASLGVSRKLGYLEDGISRDILNGEVVESRYFRLTRQRWEARERPDVTIDGLTQCLDMFIKNPV